MPRFSWFESNDANFSNFKNSVLLGSLNEILGIVVESTVVLPQESFC